MDTFGVTLVLTLTLMINQTICLQCFQCSASGPDSTCESDVTLLKDSKENGGRFSKNCTIENKGFCVIELSHNRGHVSTFIRDCSDGKTFSFDTIPQLHRILPYNQTTCGTYGTSGTVVCLSVCRTDFCNGPQNSAMSNSVTDKDKGYVFVLITCAIITNVMSSLG